MGNTVNSALTFSCHHLPKHSILCQGVPLLWLPNNGSNDIASHLPLLYSILHRLVILPLLDCICPKVFICETKGLPNWRIPRPSMDFKHVRVIVWCWDFCSKMAHGLHDQILKKSLRFQDFFFHIGFGCPTSQGPSWAGISSSVHCSVGSRGNLVSGLGGTQREEHISRKMTSFHVY